MDHKKDDSPVTIADKGAEEAMRALIHSAFPEHGVFGEEGGLELGKGEGAKYIWVLDPIDGTKCVTRESGKYFPRLFVLNSKGNCENSRIALNSLMLEPRP